MKSGNEVEVMDREWSGSGRVEGQESGSNS